MLVMTFNLASHMYNIAKSFFCSLRLFATVIIASCCSTQEYRGNSDDKIITQR